MRTRRMIRWTVLLALAAAAPANAGPMRPEEAKRFVAGKLFSYSCFDGTRGVGRIYADGAVVGTMQPPGKAPRFVAMPMGTIRVTSTAICASLRGALFEPCFDVVQTSSVSFRGSVSGLGFAYCDFVRHNPRMDLAGAKRQTRLNLKLPAAIPGARVEASALPPVEPLPSAVLDSPGGED